MNAPIPSTALTTGLSLHASLHTLAIEAWSRLRGTLEALGPLAETMDEGQVASYELAFVSAELHAMRAMLDYAGRCAEGPTPVLEERMALAFSADVITKVRQRFDRVRDAINLPGAPIVELFESPALRGFCREWLAPSSLAAVGSGILEAGQCGRSLLAEDKQIIAASFARVSAEVVAPPERDWRDGLLCAVHSRALWRHRAGVWPRQSGDGGGDRRTVRWLTRRRRQPAHPPGNRRPRADGRRL